VFSLSCYRSLPITPFYFKLPLLELTPLTVNQILEQEIKDSEIWLSRTQEESTYKGDLKKRIELLNWVLENMKNPDINICKIIESKMDEILIKIKKTDSIFELDPLDSELRILNWVLYQVSSNETKHNLE
jgi:hypothetical protein